MLHLKGHFSYIDKYSKLKFLFLEYDQLHGVNSTWQKLMNVTMQYDTEVSKPFTDKEFTVTMPKYIKITPDIVAMVGLECDVWVKITKFDFVSKLEKNKGDHVIGFTLVLDDIKRLR